MIYFVTTAAANGGARFEEMLELVPQALPVARVP
jgi:hypothetical protein